MTGDDLLRKYKSFSESENAKEIASIMNDLKNAAFGSLMPSKLDDADGIENIDIRDMPPLETGEEAEKR